MTDRIIEEINRINAGGGTIRVYARGMNLTFSERHSLHHHRRP